MRPQEPEDRALQEQKDNIQEIAELDLVRARDAASLLENPILNEVLDDMERRWNSAWRSTAPADTDKREAAYQILYAIEAFRAELQSRITGGKIAAETMASIQSVDLGRSDSPD